MIEADASGAWRTSAFVADWLISGVFALEIAAVLIVATRNGARRYARTGSTLRS